jgi:hypothetical protein
MKRIIGIILIIISVIGFFAATIYMVGILNTLAGLGFIIFCAAWSLLLLWLFD